MNPISGKKGVAIALAWPRTWCKEPGSWYDPVTRRLGFSRNNYYRAGHAALLLVDGESGMCRYYDFGRYHAPFRYGRVRSADTDHDLAMHTRATFSGDGSAILNFREILEELQHNPACHGEGLLHASYVAIDHDAALKTARQMQADSPIPYGPFVRGGSNCSRFVNTVILSGMLSGFRRTRLKYFVPLTPTPMNNVNALRHRVTVPVLHNSVVFIPLRPLTRDERSSTLPAPARNPAVPEHARWLSGEGAGSWFAIDAEGPYLRVTRYGPDGTLECTGLFEGPVDLLREATDAPDIDHLSHCNEITLRSNGECLVFIRFHAASGGRSEPAGETARKKVPEPESVR